MVPIIVIIVALVILVIPIMLVIGIYNKLVALRNRVTNAFSQIDVQLKRRHDLIPNLVETAKAYMAHERETLEAVIAARNQAANAQQQAAADPANASSMRALSQAEGMLGGAMGRFMALFENYPDLKADGQMSQLSDELTTTENKVAFARQAFNDAVMRFNTAREVFPAVVFAGMFGFQPAESFEITDPSERAAPAVAF